MTRIARSILAVTFVTASAATAWAVERFPPPDFTDHQLPSTTTPAGRWLGWEYLDVAALLAGLVLATYFALGRRSRKGLVVLATGALVWLGFWRQGCVCPIGAIQNVSLAVFDSTYAIPLAVMAFFALPLLFTLFFGRTFCAAVCPLGAVQELTLVRPVRVPGWVDHTLGLVPFIYLGAAVLFAATGTAFVICQYDPYVGFFRLSGSAAMIVFGVSLLAVGLFVGRPYCRYLCPLGAVFGLFSRVSGRHLRIPPEECIKCRLCEDACPYGAIRPPTVPQTPAERASGRRRLGWMLALAPVLVMVGALVGYGLAVPLSQMHRDVRLAERIRLEVIGKVEGTIDASDAFRNTGRPVNELYAQAIALRERFALLGGLLGGWVGLVIGVKLVHLSIRRKRDEYAPDPAFCVSCGRCFEYCPNEQQRQGLIQEIPTFEKSGV
jgi:polyferredoxin